MLLECVGMRLLLSSWFGGRNWKHSCAQRTARFRSSTTIRCLEFIITANEGSHPDLFWAVRGAGAIFGVATSFRYRLHSLTGVLGGLLTHPRERAKDFIAFYREFLRGTPDELDTTLAFLHLPDGTPVVGAIVVYAGPAEEGERVLARLRAFGPPLADLIQPMPYTAIQSLVDGGVPAGSRYYWKSNFVDVLSPDLAEVLRDGANAAPSPSPWLCCLRSRERFNACRAMRWRLIIAITTSRCPSSRNGRTLERMQSTFDIEQG